MTETLKANRAPFSPATAGERARVLIVDDDPVFLRVLTDAMAWRLETVDVEACDSPEKALSSMAAREVDVLVSDLLMSGMHGLDLLDRVKAIRPSTLVVLITGADDRELSVRALRGGAYDFIQKPVDADYLAASIRRALETRRLRVEVERQQEALRRHADQLEQTVAERTEELRRASRAKDEFLATVSHELRTPLTAILGWARLLCGGKLSAEEQSQAIESIARNARSQAQLIEDLLDVSRIITGKLRLDLQSVDLAGVLEGALAVVVPAAQARQVSVVTQLDPDLPPVWADPDRLQQVLWNLLSNAVKFTPPGGHVRVHVRVAKASVEIEVKDDGAGIEPDFLPFVFDRFRQGRAQASSRRGLGLGLAITRHLVELHGGTVSAASPGVGAGATFTVVLPCPAREERERGRKRRRLPSQSAISPEAPPGRCLDSVHVLVVDDEADTREVLRLTLEHAGAEVEVASSVSEAREVFRRMQPDVLLCDLGLGREDGHALIRELRELPPEEGGDVCALALTGYARPEDRERALAAGFELHLAKPGPPDLPEIIAGLLEQGDME